MSLVGPVRLPPRTESGKSQKGPGAMEEMQLSESSQEAVGPQGMGLTIRI